MAQQENQGLRRFLFSRYGLILAGFLAVAGYFLWAEHQAHILGNLPLILILGVCRDALLHARRPWRSR
jgi:hypothetical protein